MIVYCKKMLEAHIKFQNVSKLPFFFNLNAWLQFECLNFIRIFESLYDHFKMKMDTRELCSYFSLKAKENKIETVRPKIGNREKHFLEHRKCHKKEGKHYVKHGETEKEMGENICGVAAYRGFLDMSSLVFKQLGTYRRNNPRIS